ncbi:MAG: hypothetical protein KDB27_32295 [Planctomycetales bacterium]|nr:hypothetical protein [Planctomycetales bacterium]
MNLSRLTLEALERRCLLATYTVDSIADISSDSDDRLTLREAISLSNLNAGEDIVQFARGLTGRIELTDGEIEVTDSLRIVGPGPGQLTIDASASDPTPQLNNGDGSSILSFRIRQRDASFEISGLTMTGADGLRAGAIHAPFTAGTLKDMAFVANNSSDFGGAVYGSYLDIEDCLFENNSASHAGAVHGSYVVNILRSSFINNSASQRGGALRTRGETLILDSYFDGNTSVEDAGAMELQISGGATEPESARIINTTISNNATTSLGSGARGGGVVAGGYQRLVIFNSTLSGNVIRGSATGGAVNSRSVTSTEIYNSTLVDNSGGGIGGIDSNFGDILIENSIIANEGEDILGPATVHFSLIGKSPGGSLRPTNGSPDRQGNLIGSFARPLDPKLDVLRPNGASIPTRLPMTGSPAIGLGDPEFGNKWPEFVYDQRGAPFRRIIGDRLDAGAVELLTPADGDFDADLKLTELDIDALCQAVHGGGSPLFDLNSDGKVDHGDFNVFISDVVRTVPGDANADLVFDSQDFVRVFLAAEYEDAIIGNSTWSEGDWNCDGDFDSKDFVDAFMAGGYRTSSRQQQIPLSQIASAIDFQKHVETEPDTKLGTAARELSY